jgi:hypothetical protein
MGTAQWSCMQLQLPNEDLRSSAMYPCLALNDSYEALSNTYSVPLRAHIACTSSLVGRVWTSCHPVHA